jgi:hypothetical protein
VLKRKERRRRAKGKAPAQAVNVPTAGTRLTFRAEVMPGRGASERTFTVARVLTGGRVELYGLLGEHAIKSFTTAQL